MTSRGIRADGAIYLVIGGGIACILHGDRISRPMSLDVVERMGPWGPPLAAHSDWYELQRMADRASVVPLDRLVLT